MGRVSLLVMIMLAVTAGTVRAKIFSYRDKNGDLHVVDAREKVPREYQDQLPEAGREEEGYRLQQSEPVIEQAPPQDDDKKAVKRAVDFSRKLQDKRNEIRDLRGKASQWTKAEWHRRCIMQAADGKCPVAPGAPTRTEVIASHKAEIDKDNPYLKKAADEELRLKKMTMECR